MNYGDPITPRTRRWLRPVALIGTLALGVAGLFGVAAVRSAPSTAIPGHHAILGGSASCDDESVTFTIGNSEADKVMTFTSNHGGGTVAASGSTSITVDAQPGSTVTINVSASWPNGVTWSGSHSITVPDNCEPEETTTVPEPTTTQETTPPSMPTTAPPSSTSTTSPATTTPATTPPTSDSTPGTTTPATSAPPTTTPTPPATGPQPTFCELNPSQCPDGLPDLPDGTPSVDLG